LGQFRRIQKTPLDHEFRNPTFDKFADFFIISPSIPISLLLVIKTMHTRRNDPREELAATPTQQKFSSPVPSNASVDITQGNSARGRRPQAHWDDLKTKIPNA
jgi:hypothetical protein